MPNEWMNELEFDYAFWTKTSESVLKSCSIWLKKWTFELELNIGMYVHKYIICMHTLYVDKIEISLNSNK